MISVIIVISIENIFSFLSSTIIIILWFMDVLKRPSRAVNRLILVFHLFKIIDGSVNLFLRTLGRSQKDRKGDQHPTKAAISLFHWALEDM